MWLQDKELYPTLAQRAPIHKTAKLRARWQAVHSVVTGNIKGGRGLAGFSLILVWDFLYAACVVFSGEE